MAKPWIGPITRNSRGVPDVVEMNLYSLAGAKVLQIDRSSTTDENNWALRRGSTTISIPTGVYRLGFEYISSLNGYVQGSNWLDAINIALKALVEFNSDTVRIRENSGTAPFFLVNGVVQQASSFTINVTNGTAKEGTDFQVSNKTRSIPVGNYALQDSIQLGLTIVNNDIPENDRYFTLSIANTTGDVDKRDANADGVYQQTLVVVIEDDDACKNPGTSNTYSLCAVNATNGFTGTTQRQTRCRRHVDRPGCHGCKHHQSRCGKSFFVGSRFLSFQIFISLHRHLPGGRGDTHHCYPRTLSGR